MYLTSFVSTDELKTRVDGESERRLSFSNVLRDFRTAIPRDATHLGDFVRHPSRVGKAVSQEELAEALDVTRIWYGSLERTAVRPSIALLDRLCSVLALTMAQRLLLIVLAIPELHSVAPLVRSLQTHP